MNLKLQIESLKICVKQINKRIEDDTFPIFVPKINEAFKEGVTPPKKLTKGLTKREAEAASKRDVKREKNQTHIHCNIHTH